jgi:hypothetical protein
LPAQRRLDRNCVSDRPCWPRSVPHDRALGELDNNATSVDTRRKGNSLVCGSAAEGRCARVGRRESGGPNCTAGRRRGHWLFCWVLCVCSLAGAVDACLFPQPASSRAPSNTKARYRAYLTGLSSDTPRRVRNARTTPGLYLSCCIARKLLVSHPPRSTPGNRPPQPPATLLRPARPASGNRIHPADRPLAPNLPQTLTACPPEDYASATLEAVEFPILRLLAASWR